jgi:hypothetical protein
LAVVAGRRRGGVANVEDAGRASREDLSLALLAEEDIELVGERLGGALVELAVAEG